MMRPPKPSERLKALLRDKGWKQSEFAGMLGVTPSMISMILNDGRSLTPGIILKLGDITDEPAEKWAKLVTDWSAWAQSAEGKKILEAESAEKTSLESEIPTAGGLMVDRQILQALDRKELQIENFDPETLQCASLDLRLGVILTGTLECTDDEMDLGIGQTAWLKSFERIHLPERIVGRVGIPTALAIEGIFMSVGLQIDPGYDGHLIATARNHGSKAFRFKLRDTKIFSVEFHRLAMAPERKFGKIRTKESLPHLPGRLPD